MVRQPQSPLAEGVILADAVGDFLDHLVRCEYSVRLKIGRVDVVPKALQDSVVGASTRGRALRRNRGRNLLLGPRTLMLRAGHG